MSLYWVEVGLGASVGGYILLRPRGIRGMEEGEEGICGELGGGGRGDERRGSVGELRALITSRRPGTALGPMPALYPYIYTSSIPLHIYQLLYPCTKNPLWIVELGVGGGVSFVLLRSTYSYMFIGIGLSDRKSPRITRICPPPPPPPRHCLAAALRPWSWCQGHRPTIGALLVYTCHGSTNIWKESHLMIWPEHSYKNTLKSLLPILN